MKVGTRSLLYGVHCVPIHTFFVALAWFLLYGIPWDPRLWLAFILHDIGYWGSADMQGAAGESHPEAGARIMGRWFGPEWGRFCLYHSRYYAKRDGANHSPLCVADKLAMVLEPWWLYLPRAIATGEINEYMGFAKVWSSSEPLTPQERKNAMSRSRRRWFATLRAYMLRWVVEHVEGKEDRWTAPLRETPVGRQAPLAITAGFVACESRVLGKGSQGKMETGESRSGTCDSVKSVSKHAKKHAIKGNRHVRRRVRVLRRD